MSETTEEVPDRPTDSGGTPRRRRQLIVIIAAALTALVIGLVAGRFVRSPAEVAAETKSPGASVITAPVETRSVATTVIVSGTTQLAEAVNVTLAAPSNGADPVITKVFASEGQTIKQGDLLAEVAGRPVFVLPGEFKMYRDISPGDTGPDVLQVQSALKQVGWAIFDADGAYGPSTQQAVSGFYRNRGYVPSLEATDPEPHRDQVPEQDLKSSSANPSSARATGKKAALRPMIPASELVFVKSLPAVIQTRAVRVGSEASAPSFVLSSSKAQVKARVPVEDAERIQVGDKVGVTDYVGNIDTSGVVSGIGKPSSTEEDGIAVPITVKVAKLDAADYDGVEVEVRIALDKSSDDLPVVPISAIFTAGDGRASVLKVRGKTTTRIAVAILARGEGFAQVKPQRETLGVGDRVVVGTK